MCLQPLQWRSRGGAGEEQGRNRGGEKDVDENGRGRAGKEQRREPWARFVVTQVSFYVCASPNLTLSCFAV